MVLLMIGITVVFFNFNVAVQNEYNSKFFHENLDDDPIAKSIYENESLNH